MPTPNKIETNKLILTREELIELASRLKTANYIAFDTETNGLSIKKNVVIGFAVSPSPWEGYYIPLLCWEDGKFKDYWNPEATYPENVTNQEYKVPEFIKDFIVNTLISPANPRLLMHNAPFDCNIVYNHMGIQLKDSLHCDTILLKHFMDENSENGLKDIAVNYSEKLKWDPKEAVQEQEEMSKSVIKNGGVFNKGPKSKKEIWKGDFGVVGRYGAKDTIITYRIYLYFMYLLKKLPPKHHDLFFNLEIMPLCREVLIPMIDRGVFVDVKYFEELKGEMEGLLDRYQDLAIEGLSQYLAHFNLAKDTIKEDSRRFVEKVIKNQGQEMPMQPDKKNGGMKPTLNKKALENAFAQTGHWVWAWLLGQDSLRLSGAEIQKLKSEAYFESTGKRHVFNINSGPHLRWLIFQQMRVVPEQYLESRDYTKKGKLPSMNAKVLGKIAKDHAALGRIITYKKLRKLLSTYVIPILELNNNGWLHLSFNQSGTLSGRFSCSGGLNLQTLPKLEELACDNCESTNLTIENPYHMILHYKCKDCGTEKKDIIVYSAIKRGFIAPQGKKIVNSDFNALEVRCFAYMSGDDKLKEVYLKGLDLYSKVYCDTFDSEHRYSANPKASNYLKKVNPQMRSWIKPVVLGIVYGARKGQVANLLGLKTRNREGKEVLDMKKGQGIIDSYLDAYPALRNYMEECDEAACIKGQVETIFGRIRRFKFAPIVYELCSRKGIDYHELLDKSYKELENINIAFGSGDLAVDDLHWFADRVKMSIVQLDKIGNWQHIVGVFRNELNNAKNVRIQGLAAHLTNRAMLVATRQFKKLNLDAHICLQVHDEITCYAIEKDAEQVKDILKKAMEENQFAKQIDIPMISEPVICDNLKDSK